MRADCVVVVSPCLDHDLRLLECVEDLAVEQLIAELAIEAFAVAVLPGAARLDVGGLRTDSSDPGTERPGHELRAVIRANVSRYAMQDEEICERVDDVRGLEGSRHPDRQRLAGELVDDAQHPERPPFMGAIGNEVIGPDVVGTLRPQTDA